MNTLTSSHYKYTNILRLRPNIFTEEPSKHEPSITVYENSVKYLLTRHSIYNRIGTLYTFLSDEILDKEILFLKNKNLSKLKEVSEVEI